MRPIWGKKGYINATKGASSATMVDVLIHNGDYGENRILVAVRNTIFTVIIAKIGPITGISDNIVFYLGNICTRNIRNTRNTSRYA